MANLRFACLKNTSFPRGSLSALPVRPVTFKPAGIRRPSRRINNRSGVDVTGQQVDCESVGVLSEVNRTRLGLAHFQWRSMMLSSPKSSAVAVIVRLYEPVFSASNASTSTSNVPDSGAIQPAISVRYEGPKIG